MEDGLLQGPFADVIVQRRPGQARDGTAGENAPPHPRTAAGRGPGSGPESFEARRADSGRAHRHIWIGGPSSAARWRSTPLRFGQTPRGGRSPRTSGWRGAAGPSPPAEHNKSAAGVRERDSVRKPRRQSAGATGRHTGAARAAVGSPAERSTGNWWAQSVMAA